jgi:hypothetical protein
MDKSRHGLHAGKLILRVFLVYYTDIYLASYQNLVEPSKT